MNRFLLRLALSASVLFGASPALADSVFVTELFSGSVVKVDTAGRKTAFATGLGAPGPFKFDKNGNLFVLDFSAPRVVKVTPTGEASTFVTGIPEGGLNDLAIADDGAIFLLVNEAEPPEDGELTAKIWRLVDGRAILVAMTVNEAPVGQGAAGFTFGPGGHLYLAMQGGDGGGRIIRVTREGQVSTFFDPGLPSLRNGGADMLDVRFNSQGEMLILANVAPGNTRVIWKVKNGALSTLVQPGTIGEGALQLAIDANDNLLVSGGGLGNGGPQGAIQRVEPSGRMSTLAAFPGAGPIMDIDDDGFDSFPCEAGYWACSLDY
jgi:sugar lactone lactonase YvrE